jgi:hypothetical protein
MLSFYTTIYLTAADARRHASMTRLWGFAEPSQIAPKENRPTWFSLFLAGLRWTN